MPLTPQAVCPAADMANVRWVTQRRPGAARACPSGPCDRRGGHSENYGNGNDEAENEPERSRPAVDGGRGTLLDSGQQRGGELQAVGLEVARLENAAPRGDGGQLARDVAVGGHLDDAVRVAVHVFGGEQGDPVAP